MKNIDWIATVLLILNSCSNSDSGVRTLEYRDWSDCIELSNSKASVIINPSYGGHIVSYTLAGHDNVLWSDSVVSGWTLEDYISTRRSPDSGRFDIGNERKTEWIHDLIWAGKYSVIHYADTLVKLRSERCNKMGIYLEREYTLHPGSSRITILQRITNITTDTLRYCFWTRTLLPSGGVYRCTLDTCSRMPYSEISLSADTITNLGSDRVSSNNNETIAIMPGGTREQKWGIRNTDGIYVYERNGLRYTKRNQHIADGIYDNNNGLDFPNMVYFNSQFIEMEPNSPMYNIPPSQSVTYSELWTLENMSI